MPPLPHCQAEARFALRGGREGRKGQLRSENDCGGALEKAAAVHKEAPGRVKVAGIAETDGELSAQRGVSVILSAFGADRNAADVNRRFRALPFNRHGRDGDCNLVAFQNLPEDGVATIEMGGTAHRNEKLAGT